MPTVEIPRKDWAERLNEFTAIHEHWLVSLDVLGEYGAETAIRDLPLLGVSADRPDHDPAILVSVARSPNEYATHKIEGVRRVFLQKTDDGADAAMELESSDGTKTILRFRVSALPETVDGIVTASRHGVARVRSQDRLRTHSK